jgi:predicted ATP-dependent endonuclease of OLD family
MRIRALILSNFQCFGPNPTTLKFDDLTAFIGANGAGKTAALEALVRLFGSIPAERRLTLADFHVPPAVEDNEEPEKLTLYLEARLEFPELAEGQVGAVQFHAEGPLSSRKRFSRRVVSSSLLKERSSASGIAIVRKMALRS